MIKLSTAIALAIVLTNAVHNAHAQDWPRRAVTMIVPFAAGGPSDAQGRILALHLSDFLHQSVIVENVVGAGGMAGSARVAKAAPDGYQLLLGGSNTHVYNQTLYSKPLYNAVADFAPVAMVARSSYVPSRVPTGRYAPNLFPVRANQQHCNLALPAVQPMLTQQSTSGYTRPLPRRQRCRFDGRSHDYMRCHLTSLAQIGPATSSRIGAAAATPSTAECSEVAESGGQRTDTTDGPVFKKATPITIIQRRPAASDALDTPTLYQRWLDMGLRVPEQNERTPEYLSKLVPVEIERWRAPIKASGVLIE